MNQPHEEAHGIVWKVLVNGKDAQDEYDQMDPIGVGNHEFKVYFNRQMDTLVKPTVSYGVREPYTQKTISETGLGLQMVKSIPLLMILILELQMESIELEFLELVIWTF